MYEQRGLEPQFKEEIKMNKGLQFALVVVGALLGAAIADKMHQAAVDEACEKAQESLDKGAALLAKIGK